MKWNKDMSNGEDDLMDFGPLKIEESAKNGESITDKNKGFVYRTNRRVKIPTIVLLPKMKSTKKYKSQKTERREKIKDKDAQKNHTYIYSQCLPKDGTGITDVFLNQLNVVGSMNNTYGKD